MIGSSSFIIMKLEQLLKVLRSSRIKYVNHNIVTENAFIHFMYFTVYIKYIDFFF